MEQLWGPGGQGAGSAGKANSHPCTSKSVASRSTEEITSSTLHSLDCISNIAFRSGLLRQEKHQQTGASPWEGHQDGWGLEHLH